MNITKGLPLLFISVLNPEEIPEEEELQTNNLLGEEWKGIRVDERTKGLWVKFSQAFFNKEGPIVTLDGFTIGSVNRIVLKEYDNNDMFLLVSGAEKPHPEAGRHLGDSWLIHEKYLV